MLQDQKADAQLVGTDLESDKNKQTRFCSFQKEKKTLLQQEFSFQNAVILSIKYYFGHAAKNPLIITQHWFSSIIFNPSLEIDEKVDQPNTITITPS